jgi:outer membrane biosynthesis protein TonB
VRRRQAERAGVPLLSWRAVGLAAGLLAVLLAGLALGFAGSAFGAAERMLSGTTGSVTDPGPGTATSPVATTTAPPPDPAPVAVKKPPPRHIAPPPPPPAPARAVKKNATPTASHEPPPPVVEPPPSPAPAHRANTAPSRAVGSPRRGPATRTALKPAAPAARPQVQLPIPIPHPETVLSVQTASDFSRAPIFVTLALAILLLGAAVFPARAVPSAGLAWVLSSQVVTISFAGLTLLLLAGIEYVVMKVAS